MRTFVCEQEVIVSTRRDVAVLFRKIHALSIFHLERNRNCPETCVMSAHHDTPRAIMFTGAAGSFHPDLSHCTVWNSPSQPPNPTHPSTCTPALLLPCSAAPLASLGSKRGWFPPSLTAHQSQPHSPLTGGLGCFASSVCSWLNGCTDRDTSAQQQSWPFIFLLWRYSHFWLYWE